MRHHKLATQITITFFLMLIAQDLRSAQSQSLDRQYESQKTKEDSKWALCVERFNKAEFVDIYGWRRYKILNGQLMELMVDRNRRTGAQTCLQFGIIGPLNKNYTSSKGEGILLRIEGDKLILYRKDGTGRISKRHFANRIKPSK